MPHSNKTDTLKVGVRLPWDTLVPEEVGTVYGDIILRNVFEPLVQTERDGRITPLAAKKWEVSSDYKEFLFIIDAKKKFSDGTPLKAQHFKDSWERALKNPRTAVSLIDVMQEIEGFENFSKTGNLSGVIVKDEQSLLMKFRRPFRTASEFLSSVRYAPSVLGHDSQRIGTGAYKIQEEKNGSLFLVENPNRSIDVGFPNIEVLVVPEADAEAKIDEGKIDAYVFSINATLFNKCRDSSSQIECIYSAEMSHSVLALNQKKGIFEDLAMRRAFAALLLEGFQSKEMKEELKHLPQRYDLQFLAPLQKGRLEEKEVDAAVREQGKEHIEAFIAKTKEQPLLFVSMSIPKGLMSFLQSHGVALAEPIQVPSIPERTEYLKGNKYADIVQFGATVYGGDPDGLFHLTGRNARIRPAITGSEKVFALLEEGREVIDPVEIDRHYKEFSKAILSDLPGVHYSFGYAFDFFRRGKVTIDEKNAKWESTPLSYFRPID